jgi:hypothetical protein
MKTLARSVLMAALAASFVGVVQPVAAGQAKIGAWDAPSSFFPGKYYEQKAQFYLKKRDYAAALQMFQLSGYWADKISQYNAGLMLFKGIGVPQDKVAGAAWLQLAAESHGDLAEAMLTSARAELTPDQLARSESAWRDLNEKYGNKVALPRALARFQSDQFIAVNHGRNVGNVSVYDTLGEGSPYYTEGSNYFASKQAELNSLIEQIGGTVSVGQLQTLPLPEGAPASRAVPGDSGHKTDSP